MFPTCRFHPQISWTKKALSKGEYVIKSNVLLKEVGGIMTLGGSGVIGHTHDIELRGREVSSLCN